MVIVVPDSVVVEGVEEHPATRIAAHVATAAILAMLLMMVLLAG